MRCCVGTFLLQHCNTKNRVIVPAKAPEELEEQEQLPISIRRGHAKNRLTDLSQVIIVALVDTEYGVTLAITTQSEDKSDKLTFHNIAEKLIQEVAHVF